MRKHHTKMIRRDGAAAAAIGFTAPATWPIAASVEMRCLNLLMIVSFDRGMGRSSRIGARHMEGSGQLDSH